ncbi:MAG: hypothetical protein ACYS8W_05680 [Planctomycetota bacterium]|jgi:hypothetical protein
MKKKPSYILSLQGGIWGMVDEALFLLREKWPEILFLFGLGAFPFAAVFMIFLRDAKTDARDIYIYMLAVLFYFRAVTRGAATHYVCHAIEGVETGAWESLKAAARKSPGLFLANTVSLLGLTLVLFCMTSIAGFVLGIFLMIPTIMLLVTGATAYPAIMSSSGTATGRLLSAVRVHLAALKDGITLNVIFHVLGIFLALNLLILIYTFLSFGKVLFGIDTVHLQESISISNHLLLALVFFLTYAVLEPIWFVAVCFYYYRGTSRKTGIDLEAKLRELEAQTAHNE